MDKDEEYGEHEEEVRRRYYGIAKSNADTFVRMEPF